MNSLCLLSQGQTCELQKESARGSFLIGQLTSQLCRHESMKAVDAWRGAAGTQFTCFTSAKVHMDAEGAGSCFCGGGAQQVSKLGTKLVVN